MARGHGSYDVVNKSIKTNQYLALPQGDRAVIGGGFDRQVCGFPYSGRMAWHLEKKSKTTG
jgi:hypothetical protein